MVRATVNIRIKFKIIAILSLELLVEAHKGVNSMSKKYEMLMTHEKSSEYVILLLT
jgi:hypothetical protein